MKVGILCSISACFILTLVSCGPDRSLYGSWQGDADWKKMGLTDERVARALAAVNLDLKADGTFLLTDGGMPFEGDWTASGDTVNLKVKMFMNRNIERQSDDIQKQAIFSVQRKKDQLTFSRGSSLETIVLTKKAQPESH